MLVHLLHTQSLHPWCVYINGRLTTPCYRKLNQTGPGLNIHRFKSVTSKNQNARNIDYLGCTLLFDSNRLQVIPCVGWRLGIQAGSVWLEVEPPYLYVLSVFPSAG